MKQSAYIRRVSTVNQLALPKDFLKYIAPEQARPSFRVTCNKSRKTITLDLEECSG